MVVKTRSEATGAGAGVVLNPAANLARELITADQVLQWTLQGKCFTASLEPETAGIDGQADHDPETQDYMLTSDWTGSKVVIPICTTIGLYTLPGAGHVNTVCFMCRPILDCATTRTMDTITTTNRHILNNRTDVYGNQTATAGYTITSSDLGATEMVEIAAYQVNTLAISNNPLRNSASGIWSNTVHINHLKDGAPIVLYKGASLSVCSWCGTTDPTTVVIFQWAELDAATYLP